MDKVELTDLFEEWKKRYDADPDSFQSCAAFKAEPPASYGEAAATYFLWLIDDINSGGLGA